MLTLENAASMGDTYGVALSSLSSPKPGLMHNTIGRPDGLQRYTTPEDDSSMPGPDAPFTDGRNRALNLEGFIAKVPGMTSAFLNVTRGMSKLEVNRQAPSVLPELLGMTPRQLQQCASHAYRAYIDAIQRTAGSVDDFDHVLRLLEQALAERDAASVEVQQLLAQLGERVDEVEQLKSCSHALELDLLKLLARHLSTQADLQKARAQLSRLQWRCSVLKQRGEVYQMHLRIGQNVAADGLIRAYTDHPLSSSSSSSSSSASGASSPLSYVSPEEDVGEALALVGQQLRLLVKEDPEFKEAVLGSGLWPTRPDLIASTALSARAQAMGEQLRQLSIEDPNLPEALRAIGFWLKDPDRDQPSSPRGSATQPPAEQVAASESAPQGDGPNLGLSRVPSHGPMPSLASPDCSDSPSPASSCGSLQSELSASRLGGCGMPATALDSVGSLAAAPLLASGAGTSAAGVGPPGILDRAFFGPLVGTWSAEPGGSATARVSVGQPAMASVSSPAATSYGTLSSLAAGSPLSSLSPLSSTSPSSESPYELPSSPVRGLVYSQRVSNFGDLPIPLPTAAPSAETAERMCQTLEKAVPLTTASEQAKLVFGGTYTAYHDPGQF